MDKILQSLKAPWRRGVVAGVLDILLRAAAIVIWCATVWLCLRFVYDAVFVEIIWARKMWWIGYSAIIVATVSALAYTAVWDRE